MEAGNHVTEITVARKACEESRLSLFHDLGEKDINKDLPVCCRWLCRGHM